MSQHKNNGTAQPLATALVAGKRLELSRKMAASHVRLDERCRHLVAQIVEHVKAQGIFDQFRRDCLEELERKESYRQLKQRVESHVATFLSKQEWTDSLPKNQVRDSLRRNFHQSEVLQRGVQRLVSQALDEKAGCFRDRIGDVVQTFMCSTQQQERTGRLRQEEGKQEQKGTKYEVKSSTVSDITQLHSTVNGAHMGKAEQKTKSRTTENSRAVAGRENDDQAITKPSQVKHVIPKTIPTASTGAKAPEVDHITAKSAILLTPGALTDGASGGNAMRENEISEADPRTSLSGNISGKPETKEGKSESKEVPVTLHVVQKDLSSLDTRQSEESMNCLKTEEIETRDAGHVERGLNHSPRKPSYPLDINMLTDTDIRSSNKAFAEMESNAWSPGSCTEHAPAPSQQDVHGASTEPEPDDEKGTTSDLSDAHSDISEVSSVHTSDLSSFDDQVSSVTDEEGQSLHLDDSNEDVTIKEGIVVGNDLVSGAEREEGEEGQERPRRSKRISSRRSTREDEAEQNDPTRDQVKGTTSDDTIAEATKELQTDGQAVQVVKRKRGRPRKTDRPSHDGHRKSHQARKRKSRRRDEMQRESEDEGSDVGRKRSQRRVKRTRCYSPSSEGTREVHLPYKRSRISSKD